MTVHLIHCACPDADVASRLAEALVAERLAACASLVPGVRSVYRWQDTVERADEVLLLVKTAGDRVTAATARLQALHPYELPEVLAVEASGGSDAYLAWVESATRPGVPAA